MSVVCSSCGHLLLLAPGLRVPAWCPLCGAGINPDTCPAELREPPSEAKASPAWASAPARSAEAIGASDIALAPRPHKQAPTPAEALPYFHVRRVSSWGWGEKVFRVYVTADELLFINLGVSSLSGDGAALATTAALGGGLIPALIGGVVAQQARARVERITQALAAADEDVLRQFANEDEKSFALAVAEVRRPRIEPRSIWGLLTRGADHVAQLAFVRHGPAGQADRGTMTLDLLAINDVAVAIAEFRRLFGKDVDISVSWSSL